VGSRHRRRAWLARRTLRDELGARLSRSSSRRRIVVAFIEPGLEGLDLRQDVAPLLLFLDSHSFSPRFRCCRSVLLALILRKAGFLPGAQRCLCISSFESLPKRSVLPLAGCESSIRRLLLTLKRLLHRFLVYNHLSEPSRLKSLH
jgi:hypothetical protein